ncbi:MAG: hypothetical protein ACK4GL_08790 [Flavobacteriales bacterium]
MKSYSIRWQNRFTLAIAFSSNMNDRLSQEIKVMSEDRFRQLSDLMNSRALMRRLFDYFKNAGEDELDNESIIHHVYANEKAEYAVLRNRFFKLRKELLLLLQEKTNDNTHSHEMALEEIQYYDFRKAIFSGKGAQIIDDLKAYERHLRQLNIFELWPQSINLIIYYHQINNQLDDNKKYYKLLDEALDAQYDMNKVLAAGRKIYEYNYTNSLDKAGTQFELLKRLAHKHKKFPRFSLCQHYLSMYYKMGSKFYVDKIHITSRHLNALKNLRSKHPLMPILQFVPDYVSKLNYHLLEVQTFYHYNSLQFKKALQQLEELVSFHQSSKGPKNETQILNLITLSMAAAEYDTCRQYVDLLQKFYSEHRIKGRNDEIKVYLHRVDLFSLRNLEPNDLKDIKDFLKKYVITSQKENRADLLQAATMTLLKVYIFQKDFESAKRLLGQRFFESEEFGKPACQMYSSLLNFLENMHNNQHVNNRIAQRQTISAISETVKHNHNPAIAVERNWIVRLIDNMLRNNRN